MKIGKASDTPPLLKVLVYGESGVGKTTFACSGHDHPELSPTLVINIEGGMRSITDTTAMVTEQIHSVAELEEIYRELRRPNGKLAEVKMVVVDSATELQTCILDEVVMGGGNGGTSDKMDVGNVELKDWGRTTRLMERALRMFRDLPKHVVITALERHITPEPTIKRPNPEPREIVPDFSKKLRRSTAGYFDHVWNMVADEQGVRHMLTLRHGVRFSKTRGASFQRTLGKVVKDPNMSEIFELMKGENE